MEPMQRFLIIALSLRNSLILAFCLTLGACSPEDHAHPTDTTVAYQSVGESSPSDTEIEKLITPYREQLEDKMDIVIGNAAVSMRKLRPEGGMGNWVADAVAAEASEHIGRPVDFAIQNRGGLRINEVPTGPITVGRVFEVMPFDNLITIMQLTGEQVEEVFDMMAEDGGWPISHHARYVIDDDEADDVRLSGKKIDEDKVYIMALPDYVANGGGGGSFFKEITTREDIDLLVRDAIIQFTKGKYEIFYEIEGRVTIDN